MIAPGVTLYTTPGCPDCHALKTWLGKRGVAYRERDLSDPAVSDEAKSRYGVRVAPISVVGDQFFYGTFGEQHPRLEALLGGRAS